MVTLEDFVEITIEVFCSSNNPTWNEYQKAWQKQPEAKREDVKNHLRKILIATAKEQPTWQKAIQEIAAAKGNQEFIKQEIQQQLKNLPILTQEAFDYYDRAFKNILHIAIIESASKLQNLQLKSSEIKPSQPVNWVPYVHITRKPKKGKTRVAEITTVVPKQAISSNQPPLSTPVNIISGSSAAVAWSPQQTAPIPPLESNLSSPEETKQIVREEENVRQSVEIRESKRSPEITTEVIIEQPIADKKDVAYIQKQLQIYRFQSQIKGNYVAEGEHAFLINSKERKKKETAKENAKIAFSRALERFNDPEAEIGNISLATLKELWGDDGSGITNIKGLVSILLGSYKFITENQQSRFAIEVENRSLALLDFMVLINSNPSLSFHIQKLLLEQLGRLGEEYSNAFWRINSPDGKRQNYLNSQKAKANLDEQGFRTLAYTVYKTWDEKNPNTLIKALPTGNEIGDQLERQAMLHVLLSRNLTLDQWADVLMAYGRENFQFFEQDPYLATLKNISLPVFNQLIITYKTAGKQDEAYTKLFCGRIFTALSGQGRRSVIELDDFFSLAAQPEVQQKHQNTIAALYPWDFESITRLMGYAVIKRLQNVDKLWKFIEERWQELPVELSKNPKAFQDIYTRMQGGWNDNPPAPEIRQIGVIKLFTMLTARQLADIVTIAPEKPEHQTLLIRILEEFGNLLLPDSNKSLFNRVLEVAQEDEQFFIQLILNAAKATGSLFWQMLSKAPLDRQKIYQLLVNHPDRTVRIAMTSLALAVFPLNEFFVTVFKSAQQNYFEDLSKAFELNDQIINITNELFKNDTVIENRRLKQEMFLQAILTVYQPIQLNYFLPSLEPSLRERLVIIYKDSNFQQTFPDSYQVFSPYLLHEAKDVTTAKELIDRAEEGIEIVVEREIFKPFADNPASERTRQLAKILLTNPKAMHYLGNQNFERYLKLIEIAINAERAREPQLRELLAAMQSALLESKEEPQVLKEALTYFIHYLGQSLAASYERTVVERASAFTTRMLGNREENIIRILFEQANKRTSDPLTANSTFANNVLFSPALTELALRAGVAITQLQFKDYSLQQLARIKPDANAEQLQSGILDTVSTVDILKLIELYKEQNQINSASKLMKALLSQQRHVMGLMSIPNLNLTNIVNRLTDLEDADFYANPELLKFAVASETVKASSDAKSVMWLLSKLLPDKPEETPQDLEIKSSYWLVLLRDPQGIQFLAKYENFIPSLKHTIESENIQQLLHQLKITNQTNRIAAERLLSYYTNHYSSIQLAQAIIDQKIYGNLPFALLNNAQFVQNLQNANPDLLKRFKQYAYLDTQESRSYFNEQAMLDSVTLEDIAKNWDDYLIAWQFQEAEVLKFVTQLMREAQLMGHANLKNFNLVAEMIAKTGKSTQDFMAEFPWDQTGDTQRDKFAQALPTFWSHYNVNDEKLEPDRNAISQGLVRYRASIASDRTSNRRNYNQLFECFSNCYERDSLTINRKRKIIHQEIFNTLREDHFALTALFNAPENNKARAAFISELENKKFPPERFMHAFRLSPQELRTYGLNIVNSEGFKKLKADLAPKGGFFARVFLKDERTHYQIYKANILVNFEQRVDYAERQKTILGRVRNFFSRKPRNIGLEPVSLKPIGSYKEVFRSIPGAVVRAPIPAESKPVLVANPTETVAFSETATQNVVPVLSFPGLTVTSGTPSSSAAVRPFWESKRYTGAPKSALPGEIAQEPKWYTDADLHTYLNCEIRTNPFMGGYAINQATGNECIYRLRKPQTYDLEDKNTYLVAVTPAIDTLEKALPITYFLDKEHQIQDFTGIILGKLLDQVSYVKFSALLSSLQKLAANKNLSDEEGRFKKQTQAALDNLIFSKIIEATKSAIYSRKNAETHIQSVNNLIKESDYNPEKLALLLAKRIQTRDVFDEFVAEFKAEGNNHFKIIFPYNKTQSHWLLGEIRIHKQNHDYQIDMFAHDPLGKGKLVTKNFKALQSSITKRIKQIDPLAANLAFTQFESPYQRVQAVGDYSSCGPCTGEAAIQRILGQPIKAVDNTGSQTDEPYPRNAIELRRKQYNKIKNNPNIDPNDRQKFLARQHLPQFEQAAPVTQITKIQLKIPNKLSEMKAVPIEERTTDEIHRQHALTQLTHFSERILAFIHGELDLLTVLKNPVKRFQKEEKSSNDELWIAAERYYDEIRENIYQVFRLSGPKDIGIIEAGIVRSQEDAAQEREWFKQYKEYVIEPRKNLLSDYEAELKALQRTIYVLKERMNNHPIPPGSQIKAFLTEIFRKLEDLERTRDSIIEGPISVKFRVLTGTQTEINPKEVFQYLLAWNIPNLKNQLEFISKAPLDEFPSLTALAQQRPSLH